MVFHIQQNDFFFIQVSDLEAISLYSSKEGLDELFVGKHDWLDCKYIRRLGRREVFDHISYYTGSKYEL